MQPESIHDLAEVFSDLGRDLVMGSSPDDAMRRVAERAVAMMPNATDASISRGRDRRFNTIGATSELPPRVDAIQYELSSGPCVDAALQERVFNVGDLRSDPRWPEFGDRAYRTDNIVSMLSVRLFMEGDDLVAALNVYSTEQDAFAQSDETVGIMLATHASLALAGAELHEKVESLQRALVSNRAIGAAMGVLMNRYKITELQAFDLLRLASQHTHRKLAEVARGVTETGNLDLPDPQAAK